MIQDLGVAAIVLGAVVFLARRLFGPSSDLPTATTFVPINTLKKKPTDHCH